MSFWSNLSVKWKQIVLYLLVGILPLGVVTYINNVSFKEIQNINASNLQTGASEIADKVDRNLFERYGDVQAFALNTILRNKDLWYKPGSPIVDSMNSYVDTYDIYYLTILVDLEGKVIAVNEKDDSGNPISTGHIYSQNYKNADWFQNVVNKKFYISQQGNTGDSGFTGTAITPLHIDEEVKRVYSGDNGMSIGFAAPVYDADGNVFAVWNNYAKFSLVE
jgi:methyl-accepting chemotaxis protein